MKATHSTQQAVADFFGQTQGWASKNLLGAGPTMDYLDQLGLLTGHDPGDFVTLAPVDFSQVPASTAPAPSLAERWAQLSAADQRCIASLIDRLLGAAQREDEFQPWNGADRRSGKDRRRVG